MQIISQQAMHSNPVVRATGLLICDENNNPIFVAYELADGLLTYATVDSPDFKDKLRHVGVSQAPAIETLQVTHGQLRFIQES